jgi:hypothetical protein
MLTYTIIGIICFLCTFFEEEKETSFGLNFFASLILGALWPLYILEKLWRWFKS